MCAAFTLKITHQQLLDGFGPELDPHFPDEDFNHRVLPQSASLVVWQPTANGLLKVSPMIFGLTPSWSKDPKVKFATHNARIETLTEKPTWRGPLKNHRCLIPISYFTEPIYTGEFAGNMVNFEDRTSALLVAAGLYDQWVNKETGEVKDSFTIITGEPPAFIQNIGHDRCPLFLEKTAWAQWLNPEEHDSLKMASLLPKFRKDFNFTVAVERPLAKGWEKRVKN